MKPCTRELGRLLALIVLFISTWAGVVIQSRKLGEQRAIVLETIDARSAEVLRTIGEQHTATAIDIEAFKAAAIQEIEKRVRAEQQLTAKQRGRLEREAAKATEAARAAEAAARALEVVPTPAPLPTPKDAKGWPFNWFD